MSRSEALRRCAIVDVRRTEVNPLRDSNLRYRAIVDPLREPEELRPVLLFVKATDWLAADGISLDVTPMQAARGRAWRCSTARREG
jgi:hypothetical protein